jgi:hypothetical protein
VALNPRVKNLWIFAFDDVYKAQLALTSLKDKLFSQINYKNKHA